MNAILLTGITGSGGSWLAREAVHRKVPIKALVRGENLAHASQRMDKVLESLGVEKTPGQIEVVPGDICQDDLGLAYKAVRMMGCSMIVHCAASTEFSDAKLEQNYRTNVEGTKNVLKLASRLSIPVVHVSTAYVAGCQQGLVKENELYVNQDFNNSYERTKYQAEELVRQWSRETKLPSIILRPSILVGDSQQGRITRFQGLYDLLRVFHLLGSQIRGSEIRIIANPAATKNFIPVDYFARIAWSIIERADTGIYHITHPAPIPLYQLKNIFCRLFQLKNIHLVDEGEFSRCKPTPTERMCRNVAGAYLPYLQSEPQFDRSNTDTLLQGERENPADLDYDYIKRLYEYGQSVKWGRRSDSIQREVTSEQSIRRYFSYFLKEKMHKRLLPDLRSLSACFRIQIKEDSKQFWTLVIQDGILRKISRNGSQEQCRYVVDVPTFRSIVEGRVPPQQAFFEKQIEIEGDIEVGLRVATVLAYFFRKHPYEDWDG